MSRTLGTVGLSMLALFGCGAESEERESSKPVCDREHLPELTPQAVELTQDALIVTVQHGGGCAVHEYGLCYPDSWHQQEPAELRVTVLHDRTGDHCDALLAPVDLRLELTPLREAYFQTRSADGGQIELLLDGYSVTYEFSK